MMLRRRDCCIGTVGALFLGGCAMAPPAAAPPSRVSVTTEPTPPPAPRAEAPSPAPAPVPAPVPAPTEPPQAPADVPDNVLLFERGLASWYGPRFHGRRTASGERFDRLALTAAHRTLPFGSMVRVRHVQNGREVQVRINDCGPHRRDRIIDLSQAAAQALDLHEDGVEVVELFTTAEAAAQAGAARAGAATQRPVRRTRAPRRRSP